MARRATRERIFGVQEAAALFNVQPSTIGMWKYRGVMPEADIKLACGDIWYEATLLEFGDRTGRVVTSGA